MGISQNLGYHSGGPHNKLLYSRVYTGVPLFFGKLRHLGYHSIIVWMPMLWQLKFLDSNPCCDL